MPQPKWELVAGEDGVVDLLRDHILVAAIYPELGALCAVDKEIARKLNAFPEMLAALKLISDSYPRDNSIMRDIQASINKAESANV